MHHYVFFIWGKRNGNNCVLLAEGCCENVAGSASSEGLGWELLPATHLGQQGSILIYSVGIKWRTRGFSPPSQTPAGGSHHPQVIPRAMGWECSLGYGASPASARSKIRTVTLWFVCLRLQNCTAQRSSTAVTERTALACSLGNRGANPVNPLLCKSPADTTSTCCSWHIRITLFWKAADRWKVPPIQRASHNIHPSQSQLLQPQHSPAVSGHTAEYRDTTSVQPATGNRIFPS